MVPSFIPRVFSSSPPPIFALPSYGPQGRVPHGRHRARVGGPGAHGDDPGGGPFDADGISVLGFKWGS